MKILAVGDLHFKQNYPYAEEFDDRRLEERQKIEDAIVEASGPCDIVVLMGDIFDSRQNAAATVRDVTAFIERFGSKKVVIMAGNHENAADGSSALDYLSEVVGKDWVFVNNGIVDISIDGIRLAFVPYLRASQLGVKTNEEVVAWAMKELGNMKGLNAVFLHHAIAGTTTSTGQLTDLFNEPVFSADALHQLVPKVFGAHIHKAQDGKGVYVLGSVMNMDITESEPKRVIRWDPVADWGDTVWLPGRKFLKLVDPTPEEIENAKGKYDLVRIITSKPLDPDSLKGLAEAVKIVEAPKESRRKSNEITDFSIPNLLAIYAQERGVDVSRLIKAYSAVEGK